MADDPFAAAAAATRAAFELDVDPIEQALKGMLRAAREAQRLRAEINARGARAARLVTGNRPSDPGALGSRAQAFADSRLERFGVGLRGAGFGLLAAEQAGRVARAIGGGESPRAIVEDRVRAFVEGPFKNALRLIVVGLVIDYMEAALDRERARIDAAMEQLRAQLNLSERLRKDPAFAREVSRRAALEYEAAAADQRQRRAGETPPE